MSDTDWRTKPMTIKDLHKTLTGIMANTTNFHGSEDFTIVIKTASGEEQVVRGIVVVTPNPFYNDDGAVGRVELYTTETITLLTERKGHEAIVLDPTFAVIPRTAKDLGNE